MLPFVPIASRRAEVDPAGGGTMSSSDGQRFPVRGKSLTSRDMVIHGGRGPSAYTHVSDQWSTYGTKQIVPTAREGHDTLDELLGNATDIHGATLVNFGLFRHRGPAAPAPDDGGQLRQSRSRPGIARRDRWPALRRSDALTVTSSPTSCGEARPPRGGRASC
ncbi:Tn3 family transposase [Nonomuraea sp. NPDC051191]|uniref:Tn3 family transposase n=1 Tax=Nonomuraea sp. NPDC051191 TaxID=3364372 RepID=UPI0037A59B82